MIPPGKNHSIRLCATFVRTVNVPGRYGDGYGGHGLSLLVTPRKSGGLSKTWAQAISPNGTKTSLGLGSYPVVTLAMARERALANARAIAEGRDPRRRFQQVPTFAQANETVVAIHARHWKSERTEGQWRASMRDYVLPRLARKRVDAVTTADVMAVLLPIWSTKRVTADRVRQRIGAVMKWAVAQGYRDDNPAGNAISAALPKAAVRKQHMRALPHAEVGAALARVKGSGAYRGTVLAFEFLVLTAARAGEVRNARWEQIDRAGAVWTIPAERMKAGREHRVPLSPRALEVLDGAAELFDGQGLVFPSPTGRVLNHATLTDLLHGLGIDAVALKLIRFGGHLNIAQRRCPDVEETTAVCAGVPAPDGGAGSHGPRARGAGPRVRVLRVGDPQLGAPGGPRRGTS